MVLYGRVADLRRQYADHAVIVHGTGALDGVPGVRAVEPLNGGHKLTLAPEATAEGVLRVLLDRGMRLESFALATLPLEDIFVKVVREGLGLDRGASGPPTVDAVAGGVR
jgi:ABC-2 type transport system ATP-binding protein